jgi:hypothetical protein
MFESQSPMSNITDLLAMEPFKDDAIVARFAAALAAAGVRKDRAPTK